MHLSRFVDPHLHPSSRVLLPMEFITAMRWSTWGVVKPTTSAQEFHDRMAELSKKASEAPLFILRYHQLWHGVMDRKRIESVVGATPAIVWHRSFHELYMSKTAMDMIGVEEERIKPGMQIEIVS